MRVDPQSVRLRDYRRIAVCGTSGCGKSTLAREIGERLGVPVIELDAIHWRPGWTECPTPEFLAAVDAATDREAWVLDGNYSKSRPITLPKLELAIWLDYGFWVIFGRLLRRTMRRCRSQEELWPGCRESWRTSFFDSDSIFRWMMATYRRRRLQLASYGVDPKWAHVRLLAFRSPRELVRWLSMQPAGGNERADS